MKLIELKMDDDYALGCIRADRIEHVEAHPKCGSEEWTVFILPTGGKWICEDYPDDSTAKARYAEIVKAMAMLGNEGISEYREGYGNGTYEWAHIGYPHCGAEMEV